MQQALINAGLETEGHLQSVRDHEDDLVRIRRAEKLKRRAAHRGPRTKKQRKTEARLAALPTL
jgi:hypothetical protein